MSSRAPRRATSSSTSTRSRSPVNRASISARSRSVGDTRLDTGVGPPSSACRLRREPTSVVIYTGAGTRPSLLSAALLHCPELSRLNEPGPRIIEVGPQPSRDYPGGATLAPNNGSPALNAPRSTARSEAGVGGGTERQPAMLLQDKVAVIYGAGGAVGGAVARAFGREGPRCFSPGATWHRSKRSPRRSFQPAGPPRRQRSTRSTSRPSTSTSSRGPTRLAPPPSRYTRSGS